MTTLSKKKDMGYAKINKRHAQESIMKKRKRSWTHEGPSILKKGREKELDT